MVIESDVHMDFWTSFVVKLGIITGHTANIGVCLHTNRNGLRSNNRVDWNTAYVLLIKLDQMNLSH